jgi:serine protease inhibitor
MDEKFISDKAKQKIVDEIYNIIKPCVKENENQLIEDYIPVSALPNMQRDLANLVEKLVMPKTTDIEPVIMNITQERYERVMNLLDNIEHKRVEITFNQFTKDKMDNDYKIAKLIEQIEIMQKTATEIKHTLSSFSA